MKILAACSRCRGRRHAAAACRKERNIACLVVDWARLFGYRWVSRWDWARLCPGTPLATARHWERTKASLWERGYRPGEDLILDPDGSAAIRLTPRGLARARRRLDRALAEPFPRSRLSDTEISRRVAAYEEARHAHPAWTSISQATRFRLAGL